MSDTMGSLAATDEYDPFAAEKFVNPAVGPMIGSILSLPRRAIENSQYSLDTGTYDPAVPVEAAMTVMGGSAVPRIPVGAGEVAVGAGPIRAYHGSPHDFDAFDLSKIGTGEGAQAYGHGLYFAENEGVARSYRDALAPQLARDPAFWADKNLPKALTPPENNQLTILGAEMRAQGNLPPEKMQTWKELYDRKRTRDDAIEAMKPKGSMYEVNINADPAHFLDWDKPLSGQSQKVQEVATSLAGKRMDDLLAAQKTYGITNPHDTLTGEELYRGVGQKWMDDKRILGLVAEHQAQQQAASVFREAGIPGIKYLDQGSRATDASRKVIEETYELLKNTSQGPEWAKKLAEINASPPASSNYVVFNDKLIDIMRKYGLAGAIGAGGMGALAAQDEYQ